MDLQSQVSWNTLGSGLVHQPKAEAEIAEDCWDFCLALERLSVLELNAGLGSGLGEGEIF